MEKRAYIERAGRVCGNVKIFINPAAIYHLWREIGRCAGMIEKLESCTTFIMLKEEMAYVEMDLARSVNVKPEKTEY